MQPTARGKTRDARLHGFRLSAPVGGAAAHSRGQVSVFSSRRHRPGRGPTRVLCSEPQWARSGLGPGAGGRGDAATAVCPGVSPGGEWGPPSVVLLAFPQGFLVSLCRLFHVPALACVVLSRPLTSARRGQPVNAHSGSGLPSGAASSAPEKPGYLAL